MVRDSATPQNTAEKWFRRNFWHLRSEVEKTFGNAFLFIFSQLTRPKIKKPDFRKKKLIKFGPCGLMVSRSTNERNTPTKNETRSRIYLPCRRVFRRFRSCLVCGLRGLLHRAASSLIPPHNQTQTQTPRHVKTNTLKKLIENSSVPAPLIRAVVRQIGGWENFVNAAPDIANHGIDGGFNGFIYYTETLSFAKRNRAHIQKMAKEQAAECGSSVVEMIQNFGCLRNDKPTESEICTALYGGRSEAGTGNVLNALAWYAGEEVARAFRDLTEND